MDKSRSIKRDDRTRNWTFIVYPESAPGNWREILDEEHIQWIESPLHDKDMVVGGKLKKSHWHIVVMFAGKKSYEQIEYLTDKISATIPQKCANVKGLVRYMAHLDNPEKVQYNSSEITAHGGADLAELLRPTGFARYMLIGEMMDFVNENGITEYQDLASYARKNRFDDWFPLLCDSATYFMGTYIKSIRHGLMK